MLEERAKELNEAIIPTYNVAHELDVPVLSVEEDCDDEVDIEKRYEVVFRGEIPSCTVGLEMRGQQQWYHVIQKLAKAAASRGETTMPQAHNLALLEKRLGSAVRNDQNLPLFQNKKNRVA